MTKFELEQEIRLVEQQLIQSVEQNIGNWVLNQEAISLHKKLVDLKEQYTKIK